jgi:hypothetical protein
VVAACVSLCVGAPTRVSGLQRGGGPGDRGGMDSPDSLASTATSQGLVTPS